uniref:(northern house mosquito) hypothetical protein n=1 Tax=Culex pipiens TaxID=7175 RepID=A0A8D8C1S9_CULPI
MSTSRRLSNYLCEGLRGIAKWHRPRGWWLYPRLARYSALSDLRSEESLGFQSQVNLCVKVPDNTPSFCYRTMLVSENVYRFLHVQQPHSARLPDIHEHLPTRVSGSIRDKIDLHVHKTESIRKVAYHVSRTVKPKCSAFPSR